MGAHKREGKHVPVKELPLAPALPISAMVRSTWDTKTIEREPWKRPPVPYSTYPRS